MLLHGARGINYSRVVPRRVAADGKFPELNSGSGYPSGIAKYAYRIDQNGNLHHLSTDGQHLQNI